MSDAGAVPSPSGTIARHRPLRSRRLLHLAGDARLVEQIRRGNDAAFEVAFERHAPAILSFCRHMLRSAEEAEDAVQHTFAAAYRHLRRNGEREIALKPWLFAIARNRCTSVLRARREVPMEDAATVPTEALVEQVERRAELRRVVADVRELPEDQRAALLLAELGDLSHADVAGVLGCEVARVKALVYRARSHLIARRAARETPCEEIRLQLATLRGGALRRNELRLHLRDCHGCRTYRDEVRCQRGLLAAALPVVPTASLKSSVLAAVGVGGSAGATASVVGSVGGGLVAKVAVVSALAGGGMVAGEVAIDAGDRTPVAPGPAHGASQPSGGTDPARGGPAGVEPGTGREASGREDAERSLGDRGAGRHDVAPERRPRALGRYGIAPAPGPDLGKPADAGLSGRGPIEAPPGTTPVRRGPPEKAEAEEDGTPRSTPEKEKDGEATGGKPENTGKPEEAPKPEKTAEPKETGKPLAIGPLGGAPPDPRGRAKGRPESPPGLDPAGG